MAMSVFFQNSSCFNSNICGPKYNDNCSKNMDLRNTCHTNIQNDFQHLQLP